MKWVFAENVEEKIIGFNDPGVETFKHFGREYSLVREAIQNSLDARKDIDEPVVVKIKQGKIKKSSIIDLDGYLEIIRCIKSDKVLNSQEKLINFTKNVELLTMNDEINYIKISDYNTTGLSDVFKNTGGFQALTNSEGFSLKKNSNSGGSFGIGKSVFWANSQLRQVFFNTYNTSQEHGFIGISLLSSFQKNGSYYRNVGYLGNGFKAISRPIGDLEKEFRRTKTGTDIMMLEPYCNIAKFYNEILLSTVLNFYVAIISRNLVVHINDEILNHMTIKSYLVKINSNIKMYDRHQIEQINNYFKIYYEYNSAKIYENDKFRIRLLNYDSPNTKIYGTRESGMIIQNIKYLPKRGVCGIITIHNPNISAIFKRAETPQHNSWSRNEIEDSKHLSDFDFYNRDLRKFINEAIEDFKPKKVVDKFEFKDLDTFLNVSEKKIITKVRKASEENKSKPTKNNLKNFSCNIIRDINHPTRYHIWSNIDVDTVCDFEFFLLKSNSRRAKIKTKAVVSDNRAMEVIENNNHVIRCRVKEKLVYFKIDFQISNYYTLGAKIHEIDKE